MPNIADFRVVTDATSSLVRGGTNFVRAKFNLPNTLVPDESGVLFFRIEAEHPEGLKYEISINSKNVITLTHNQERFGSIHEVINANVLRIGENQFMAVATDGEGTLKISDVVVFFQTTV